VIDRILTEASTSSFDFREFANPADPLSALFSEWVPYYRLKFCIAKVLQPKSILEIGVRYGYSVRTFLEASPDATLLGIDMDSAEFGGQIGALDWARRITAEYHAEYVVADSQKMDRFPGGIYDLIHVDGQQDGFGTFHDLRRAVSQAHWVLLDGYFWTRPNFLDANDFLLKFKEVISYVVTIPGYAGELLIRVSDDYLSTVGRAGRSGGRSADQGASVYSSNYASGAHGPHAVKPARNFRPPAFLALTQLARGRAALALGCGWGEIAYDLAASSHHVCAVDDASSIDLAKKHPSLRDEELRRHIEFICADVTQFRLERKFDIAVAADLIEQLPPAEAARLYETVAQHLKNDGVFILHTYPNVWFYKRKYRQLRAAAESLGGYLPAEPRSRYELEQHVNEQSPAGLRRDLNKSFRHVKVWTGDTESPGENLLRGRSIGELIKAPHVYALASHSSLDLERAKRLLTQPELPPGAHAQILLSVNQWPERVNAGSTFQLSVTVANRSTELISSMPPHPINVSYHWFLPAAVEPIVFGGIRSNLSLPLPPGNMRQVLAVVAAPHTPGLYRLVITLVQEGCCWFHTVAGSTCPTATILVA
jgi:2-polyprenyl-3-methyl-5-hydroxy-6-metoxy-1,4-benzoquinol methylase